MNLRTFARAGLCVCLTLAPAAAFAGTRAGENTSLKPSVRSLQSPSSTTAGPPGHDPANHNGNGGGNHYGWDKPHTDNGNHYGWYKSNGC
jgi:hypothetical protein